MSQTLTLKIKKQAKLDYLLPFIPLFIVIVLASVFFCIRKSLGISETTAGLIISAAFVIGIALIVWYNLSPQGKIYLRESEITICPFMRKPIKILLPPLNYSFKEWWRKTNAPNAKFVGPVLVLESNGKTVTIGCIDPGWRTKNAMGESESKTLITCQFVIEPRDFTKLIDHLGLGGK